MKVIIVFWLLAFGILGCAWLIANHPGWVPFVILFIPATLAGLLWPAIRRER